MCGRYLLKSNAAAVERAFGIDFGVDDLEPCYNVAPTMEMPVVRADPGDPEARRLDRLRWGLIPFWAKEASIGNRMINARGESVAEKPAFRAAFRKRRCVVPMDGFYEWKKTDQGKRPALITVEGGGPFGVAGLWEHWEDPEGKPVETYTVLTTDANDLLREVHHRMPVILDPSEYGTWLDPRVQDREALEPLVRAFPSERMAFRWVSKKVNNVRNQGADVLGEDEES